MGLNAEVWRCIDEELSSHFTLHLLTCPASGVAGDLVRYHLLNGRSRAATGTR